MKSRPWGRKTPPASTHRPRRLLHPPRLRLYFRACVHISSAWPSATPAEQSASPSNDVRPCRAVVHTSAPSFTLPPHTLRRRPRRLRPSAAAVIHNGLSTEKLSTSLLAALCKTFSPSRLRTRIYNISFARRPLPGSVCAAVGKRSRRCGHVARAGVRRVGEGEGKGGRPLAQCPALSLPTAEPLPVYGRITVRKGGVHKAIPAPARAFSPRQPAYGRALCPLMGEVPCAGWGG